MQGRRTLLQIGSKHTCQSRSAACRPSDRHTKSTRNEATRISLYLSRSRQKPVGRGLTVCDASHEIGGDVGRYALRFGL